MSKALKRLGYTEYPVKRDVTVGYFKDARLDVQSGQFICDFAPHHYWWFYRNYPGAKFIMTTRDKGTWLRSLKNYREVYPVGS